VAVRNFISLSSLSLLKSWTKAEQNRFEKSTRIRSRTVFLVHRTVMINRFSGAHCQFNGIAKTLAKTILMNLLGITERGKMPELQLILFPYFLLWFTENVQFRGFLYVNVLCSIQDHIFGFSTRQFPDAKGFDLFPLDRLLPSLRQLKLTLLLPVMFWTGKPPSIDICRFEYLAPLPTTA
jgi:hypothetical protein